MQSCVKFLAAKLVKLLIEKRLTVAVAESCTGGLVGSLIAGVPGASAVFHGGYITYTVSAKREMLKIDADLLEKFGAVSGECACAMAEAARALTDSGIAVAITGLAGPSGDGSANKIGTVWVAGVHSGHPALARAYRFSGGRNSVRRKAAAAAIELGLELVKNL
ncbi:MAG: CinA family protein [Spirochaetaceae bacterium]|jgi:PncC family amidohydrolase|nr:CinA family protein [Spirochaetaceae bacterium]